MEFENTTGEHDDDGTLDEDRDTNEIRSIPALVSCLKFGWNKLFSDDYSKEFRYTSDELDQLVDHDQELSQDNENYKDDSSDLSIPIIPEKELEMMAASNRIFNDAYAFKKRESIPIQKFHLDRPENVITEKEKSTVPSKKKRQKQSDSVDKKDIICQIWYFVDIFLNEYNNIGIMLLYFVL